MLIPMAVQSEVWVCSCLLAWIVGSNLARGMDVCQSIVFSGSGLCNRLIACTEESYWLWCV